MNKSLCRGRNYQKQKKKVALYHEKIKNQRKDFQHKLSHSLAEDYDAGNIKSVEKALLSLGQEVTVTAKQDEILGADKIVFDGC